MRVSLIDQLRILLFKERSITSHRCQREIYDWSLIFHLTRFSRLAWTSLLVTQCHDVHAIWNFRSLFVPVIDAMQTELFISLHNFATEKLWYLRKRILSTGTRHQSRWSASNIRDVQTVGQAELCLLQWMWWQFLFPSIANWSTRSVAVEGDE